MATALVCGMMEVRVVAHGWKERSLLSKKRKYE